MAMAYFGLASRAIRKASFGEAVGEGLPVGRKAIFVVGSSKGTYPEFPQCSMLNPPVLT